VRPVSAGLDVAFIAAPSARLLREARERLSAPGLAAVKEGDRVTLVSTGRVDFLDHRPILPSSRGGRVAGPRPDAGTLEGLKGGVAAYALTAFLPSPRLRVPGFASRLVKEVREGGRVERLECLQAGGELCFAEIAAPTDVDGMPAVSYKLELTYEGPYDEGVASLLAKLGVRVREGWWLAVRLTLVLVMLR